MTRRLLGCTLLFSKRLMRRTNDLKKRKSVRKSSKERREKKWTWKMQPDTSKESGNGTKKRARILPKREAKRAERARNQRRSDHH